MRTLSLIIVLFIASVCAAQSPHGNNFKRDCQDCHTVDGWSIQPAKMKFKHVETGFALVGQHQNLQCKSCHNSLNFVDKKGKTNCSDCHSDIHENTVGKNCVRCHNPNTWIIEKVTDLHLIGKFPLLGNHAKADCRQCHKSASSLRFEPIGIRCYDCHANTYAATNNPNHVKANFSTECNQCHNFTSTSWFATSIIHDFFPLTGAHNIANCFSCHSQGSYKGLSQDCYTCHQKNYDAVQSPNHAKFNFSKDCKQCHTIKNGSWKPATYSNHDLVYPLLGAHNSVRNECSKCHSAGYNSTQRQCVSCHQSKYDATVNPNHKGAQFSTQCETCHSSTAWKPATFDHDGKYFPIYSGEHKGKWNNCSDCHLDQTNYKNFECTNCHEHAKNNMDSEHQGVNGYSYQSRACYACHPGGSKQGVISHSLTKFPLLGAHTTVSCTQCHQTGYAGTPTECVSCHQAKYTTAPNHSSQNYPLDCKQCHSSVDWKQISFNHSITKFPLLGAHKSVGCNTCHSTKLVGTPTACYSCHQAKYTAATNHVSQGYPTTCEQCHNTTDWKATTFNHSTTKFPLLGSHVTVKCSSCHTSGFTGTPTACYSCHQAKYTAATNHVSQGYPTTCEQCHNSTDWKATTFNHAATRFPLLGSHVAVKCSSCHASGFTGTPTACYSCHQAKYTAATNHVSQGYPTTCEQCHNSTDWKSATFNHATTKFPLLGSHVTVKCSSCHTSGFSGTPTACYSCHQAKYTAATNHVSQGYPTTCEQCHNSTDWKSVTFNHATTKFPLLGSHVTVKCSSCHTSGFTGTPTACYSCHQAKYTAATNHVSQGYPTTCEQCHNSTDWKATTFNHSTTKFPLLGSHVTVKCSSCHASGFTGTPTACYSCHQAKYTAATNHVSQGYPTTCEQCHNPSDWKSVTFNHATTKFPLLGSHVTVKCNSCHTSGFTETSTACYSCHQAKYTSATNHVSQGYPTTCEQCHNSTDWKATTFNHSTTKFPLFGSHVTVKCSSCHTSGFTGTPTACYSCHQAKYTAATNHVSQGYPTTCEQCHNSTDWKAATFNHSTTSFPLTGAHISVVCNSCHTTTFKGTSTICSSCHTQKYQSTTNPNHAVLGIPNTCEQCHTTSAGWKPATFPIHNNYYQILGAHLPIANQCANCHAGNYNTKHNGCVSCHLTDYNSVANPNHATAKFPTSCESCHTQTVWKPSTFNHDGQYFPIYSGEHRGKWSLCTDCHTNQSNYKVFECINCHEHNKSDMDSEHRGKSGYVYQSTACYSCHPTGKS